MNVIRERNEWDSLLKQEFSEYYDVYFTHEYFELHRKHYGVDLEAILWEDNKIKIFWPHLVRDISRIKQFSNLKCYDLTTPYGYGGPLIVIKGNDGIKESLKQFLSAYEDYASKRSYICEFVRFHPVFENWKFVSGIIDVEHLNDTVVVNLSRSLDEIWGNMEKETRRFIRKVQEEFEEIIVTDNPTDGEIRTFLCLYYDTMKKNDAAQKYFFPYEFIKNHFDLLRSLLIYCKNRSGDIGASGIFLRDTNLLHYHLSSTNYNFRSSPSRLVIWKAIDWGKENGFRDLHLGGGRGKNDGLLDFKKGFSKTILPFYIGKKVFNTRKYKELQTLNPFPGALDDYFPAYRKGLDQNIV